MSLSSFLQTWGFTAKSKASTKQATAYGVLSHRDGVITVRAHSGEDALKRAVPDGVTIAGNRSIVANHKGGGVYEVRVEDWRG